MYCTSYPMILKISHLSCFHDCIDYFNDINFFYIHYYDIIIIIIIIIYTDSSCGGILPRQYTHRDGTRSFTLNVV
jgi:hypothetical protein